MSPPPTTLRRDAARDLPASRPEQSWGMTGLPPTTPSHLSHHYSYNLAVAVRRDVGLLPVYCYVRPKQGACRCRAYVRAVRRKQCQCRIRLLYSQHPSVRCRLAATFGVVRSRSSRSRTAGASAAFGWKGNKKAVGSFLSFLAFRERYTAKLWYGGKERLGDPSIRHRESLDHIPLDRTNSWKVLTHSDI